MGIRDNLLEIATAKCIPWLKGQSEISQHIDAISLVLVGSVATGLCTEQSDIDIAVISEASIIDIFPEAPLWAKGRPTESILDGVQVHYFGISFAKIQQAIHTFDDVYIEMFRRAIPVWDPNEQYRTKIVNSFLGNPNLRKQRFEGKFDMLVRRTRALTDCMQDGDIIATGKLCLEVVTLLIKSVALLDDVTFDPRKRLCQTALSGLIGQQITPKIDLLFSALGAIFVDRESSRGLPFLAHLAEIIQCLSKEATQQGFAIQLLHPDQRHNEP